MPHVCRIDDLRYGARMDSQKRRSRMSRTRTGKRIELSSRDIAIFKLLERYRYLRSTFIQAFVGGASETRFKERLGDLFHEGYLDRPSQQWQFANCLHAPTIYEIGEGARCVLGAQIVDECESVTVLSQSAHRQFGHSLMICDMLASMELGVRSSSGLRLICWQEILAKAPQSTQDSRHPFRIPVPVPPASGGKNTVTETPYIIPDGLFGLEYSIDGKKSYRFFALEVDRATMPIARTGLHQSSFLKKILSYREIAGRRLFQSYLGLPNLLVLTITTSERHKDHLMTALSNSTDESAIFLFKAKPQIVVPMPSMLTAPWERVGFPPMCIATVS